MASHQQLVSAFYLAYYGRPADAGGMAYWAQQLQLSGGNLSDIVDAFANSPESTANFGGLSTPQHIAVLYEHLLSRQPEPAGAAYWLGEVNAGRISLAKIAISLYEGALGSDASTVQVRQQLADQFTAALPASGAGYSGQAAIEAARLIIQAASADTNAADVAALASAGVALVASATTHPALITTLTGANGHLTDLLGTTAGAADPLALVQLVATIVETAAGNGASLTALLGSQTLTEVLATLRPGVTLTELDSTIASGGFGDGAVVINPGSDSGGGGGGGPTPTPTFTATVVDGVVTFSGTATGTITVSVDIDGTATFVLGGITTTVTGIAGKAIQLVSGQMLALSAANVSELAGVALQGAGTIQVTEPLSIAQLTALQSDSAWTGTLTYTAVADTAVNLGADGGQYAKNVAITISGVVTLAELAAIKSHMGTGSLAYTQIEDTAANLQANTDGFVWGSVNVAVQEGVSVSQLAAIDALTTGTVSAQQLEDTIANLYPQGVLSVYVTAGTQVHLLDAASITQLLEIFGVVGSDNLEFTAIADTAPHLLEFFVNGTTGLPDGIAVTVGDGNAGALSVADVGRLKLITTVDSWAYSLEDKAENLTIFDPTGDGLSASPTIQLGTNVTLTDAASIAQIERIDSANGDGTLSYSLADTAENLADAATAHTVSGAANTTVFGNATIEQINAVLQIAGLDAGTLTYNLSDTAAKLLDAQNTATVQGATAITLAGNNADALTLEQVTALRTLTNSSSWTYSLADTLENLQALGTSALIAGATGVTVTGTGGQGLTVAEVSALVVQLPGGVWKYSLTDTADKLLELALNAPLITGATSVSVTSNAAGTLTVANVTALLARTTVDDWSYSLTDTAQKLLAAGTVTTTGAAKISVTDNAAGKLTVANVTTLRALTEDDDWTFSLDDTAANLAATASTAIVGDATAITVNGSATVAQIVSITNAVAPEAQLSYSLKDTRAHIDGAADTLLSAASYIDVTDTATIAQLAAIDARTDKPVLANFITDTAAHIFTTTGFAYLGKFIKVTVTDTISVGQIEAAHDRLEIGFGKGSLTYTAVSDTARNLLDAKAAGIISADATVTVLGNAARDIAVAEVALLCVLTTVDSWTYSLVDTADVLTATANNTIFQGAFAIAVQDASIADLVAVDSKTTKPVTAKEVIDSAAKLFYGGTLSAYVVSGTDVTVTDAISIAQLQAIRERVGKSGELDIEDISDTAANLLAHLLAYQTAYPDGDAEDFNDATVTVTDALTVAQATELLPLMQYSEWNYRLADTLAHLQHADAADALEDATSYALTDDRATLVNLTPEQVELVQGANNAASYDVVAPTFASVTGNGTQVVLTFSEAIQAGSGDIVIKKVIGGDAVATIPVGDAQVSINGAVVTLSPTAGLAESTAYYVEIAATAFTDLAGNAYAGISGTTTLNFTTAAAVTDLVVTQDTLDIAAAFAGYNGTDATVDATDMTAAQLLEIATAQYKVANNGITGTFTITSSLFASSISSLLGKTAASATVTVETAGMAIGALAAVGGVIGKVDVLALNPNLSTPLLEQVSGAAADVTGKTLAVSGTAPKGSQLLLAGTAAVDTINLAGVTATNAAVVVTGLGGADTIDLRTSTPLGSATFVLNYTAASDGGTTGDVVTGYHAATDSIRISGGLAAALEVGVVDTSLPGARVAFNGGGSADNTAGFSMNTQFIGVSLKGNARETVSAADLGDRAKVATLLDADFNIVDADSTSLLSRIFAVQSKDVTGTFGLYVWTQSAADDTSIGATELKILGIVTGDGFNPANIQIDWVSP